MEVKWTVTHGWTIERQEVCEWFKEGKGRSLKAKREDGALLEVKMMYFKREGASESYPEYCCRVSLIPGENKKDFYVTYLDSLPELEKLLTRFEMEADLSYVKEWTGEWPPNNCCVYVMLLFFFACLLGALYEPICRLLGQW